MKQEQKVLIGYRMKRAWDSLDDANILITNKKWNSSINRLYYAAYYAVMALLLKHGLKPATHNGAKTNFTEHFIKSEAIDKKYGKLYAQLFTWRQKGDYDDMFDFVEEQVVQYVEPVNEFLTLIESLLNENEYLG